MSNDLQELGGMRMDLRDGGDLRKIIDRLISKTALSPSQGPQLKDSLTQLKDQLNKLAQSFLQGTIKRTDYTLEWDEIVRSVLRIIEQLEVEQVNKALR